MCEIDVEQLEKMKEKYLKGEGFLTHIFICNNCCHRDEIAVWKNKTPKCLYCGSENMVLTVAHGLSHEEHKPVPKKDVPEKLTIYVDNYNVGLYKYAAYSSETRMAAVGSSKEDAAKKLKKAIQKQYPHVKEFKVEGK